MWTFAERQHARETDEAGESWPNGEDGRQGVWVSFAPRVSVAKRACCWATHSRPAQAIVAATTARGVGLSACFSDGCTGYLAVLIAAFHIVTTFARPGKRGRPHQSVCEPHPALLYGQLIKQKKQGKLLTLSTRVVLGAECLTHLGLRMRTALVKRLNLILRQTLAPWVRKASSFCKDRERLRQ